MATLQATTASNWPAIDPAAANKIKAIIDDYDFVGNWGDLTVAVEDSADEEPCLVIHGHATFEASKPILNDEGDPIDREHGYTEEFLKRIAPHLKEQLVVESIGNEKCRFPLIAGQWTAWPDGTVQHDSLNHSPEKPDADAQHDSIQYGVLNTERDILLKLGAFGPSLTSSREKAIENAQGEDHLKPVRIETVAVSQDGDQK